MPLTPRRITIVIVYALLSCVFAQPVSATIIIDDYETGADSVTADTANVTFYDTQSGLSVLHTAGGVRHEDLYTSYTPASIQIAGGAMSITAQNASNYFNITYNANASSQGGTPYLNLDLTGEDRFEVTFTRLDRPMGFGIRVRSGNTYGYSYVTATTPGVVSADLTSFSNYGSINWADIDMVRLEITMLYLSGTGVHTETISDFRTVPEPASLSLILAAGGLYLRRRRQG